MALPTMKYPGDKSGEYDRANRTGLVGKVVGGPRRWYLITAASYDEDTDTTFATVEPVLHPEVALSRIQQGGAQ